MIRKYYFSLLIIFSIVLSAKSETYLMGTDTLVTTCSDTIYDSGGSDGDYLDDENYSMLVYTATPGKQVKLSISYDIDAGGMFGGGDHLMIYNGPDATTPLLQDLDGSGTIIVTGNNNSGTLYLVFTSTSSDVKPGFTAIAECVSSPVPSENDCLGARPICGFSYKEESPTGGPNNGMGNYSTEIYEPEESECNTTESSGIWYIYTVQASGSFRFTINPVTSEDDYDWILFDANDYGCGDYETLSGRDSSKVSSNSAGASSSTSHENSGPTGINSDNSDTDDDCAGPGDTHGNQWNGDIYVNAGEQYILYIANYSQSDDGYTISFNEGSSDIVDQTPPALDQITSLIACGEDQITFIFTERVVDSTVTKSDFTVTGPGGVPYLITNVNCNSGSTYGQSYTITLDAPLTAGGTYSLNLVGQVDDACANHTSVNSLSFTVSGVTGSISNTNVTCNGDADGTVLASASGGTEPYSYKWDNDSTTANMSGLSAGTYSITITDSSNVCQYTQSVTITQPDPISVTAISNSPVCEGSTLTLTGGDNGLSSYSWTGPAYSNNTQSPTVSASATTAMTGTYKIVVKDANGCADSTTTSVTVNPLPDVFAGQDQSISTGTSTLINDATVNGSLTPTGFDYSWSPAGDLEDATILHPTTNNLTSTTKFTLQVTDQSTSCKASDDVMIIITGGALSVVTSADTSICLGDTTTITSNGSGGSGTYTYKWSSNPAGYTANTQNITVSPTTTTTYTVEVDDGSNTKTADVIVTVNALPTISIAATPNDTLCVGIDLTLTATGNADTYLWNNSVINATPFAPTSTDYIVTATNTTTNCQDLDTISIVVNPLPVIDSTLVVDLLCNGDNTGKIIIYSASADSFSIDNGTNIQTDSSFTNLVAGNYNIWVSNEGSCVTVGNATVNEPAVLELDSVVTPVICEDKGSAKVVATGGTLPYSFLWSTTETTETINNLDPTTYTCTVTDFNSCTESISVIVPDAGNVAGVVFNNIQNVLCYGGSSGSVTAVLDNNNLPFTYTWSHDASLNDSIANNLSVGDYYVTIHDSYGCVGNDTVTITQPSALDISVINYNNPLCYNGTTGTISVNADGGTPSYSFSWSNGSITQDLNNLNAGNYILTVTDANYCKDTVSQSLTNPTQMQLSDKTYIDPQNHHGVIVVTVVGGTPDYQYLWSNNKTDSIVSGLNVGNYTLTVTDDNGCTVENYYKIEMELIIPSVITPNGDLYNNTFEIVNIGAFEEADIKIFNRWGDIIFDYAGTGEGYDDKSKQWDGTYNGKELPIGTFVYIIDLKNEDEPYTGTVTIVR